MGNLPIAHGKIMEYVWTKIIGTNMGFTVLTCARRGTTGRFVMGYMYLYIYIISYGSILDDDDDKQNDLPGAI
jgi:hypothetical protein